MIYAEKKLKYLSAFGKAREFIIFSLIAAVLPEAFMFIKFRLWDFQNPKNSFRMNYGGNIFLKYLPQE